MFLAGMFPRTTSLCHCAQDAPQGAGRLLRQAVLASQKRLPVAGALPAQGPSRLQAAGRPLIKHLMQCPESLFHHLLMAAASAAPSWHT